MVTLHSVPAVQYVSLDPCCLFYSPSSCTSFVSELLLRCSSLGTQCAAFPLAPTVDAGRLAYVLTWLRSLQPANNCATNVLAALVCFCTVVPGLPCLTGSDQRTVSNLGASPYRTHLLRSVIWN